MAIQERLYTVDDVWRLSQLPENEHKHFYLINGELFWDMPPGYTHGRLEILIGHLLLVYAEEHDLGKVTGQAGYYPADDRQTLLGPDVAFIRKDAAPEDDHAKFVSRMPDLAVEIQSPSNTLAELRRKGRGLSGEWHRTGMAGPARAGRRRGLACWSGRRTS